MADDPLTIIHGDALSSLRTLESESVQTCVTSPPYWGLRDYGLEPSIWGPLSRPWEPAQCQHKWGAIVPGNNRGGSGPNGKNGYGEEYGRNAERGAFCECGAWRGQLGLEPTPELYVSHLVEAFREVKRVLRGDGTLWLNLGDSYAGSGPSGASYQSETTKRRETGNGTDGKFRVSKTLADRGLSYAEKKPIPPVGLKSKDLVGIPWMVAFALRADGWYLRSDIIWAKPNPMPESVTDRPTKAHEYIFLLSKSERYYYNADAIREPHSSGNNTEEGLLSRAAIGDPNGKRQGTKAEGLREKGRTRPPSRPPGYIGNINGRNKRSVWAITTAPYPDAHFATFPKEIPRLCILAGSKPGDVVMDCFAGSGTTPKVAIELGRKAIAIEPKAEYIEMIKKRCQTTIGLPLAI